MYNDLPDYLKQRILSCFLADDFPTAKQIYDAWKAKDDDPDTLGRCLDACSPQLNMF